MQKKTTRKWLVALCLTAGTISRISYAQEAEDPLVTELELGAIFTSGNTENQNVKFKGTVTWLREAWEYGFSLEGFRSSEDDELSAQRVYGVADATFNMTEDTFILTRAAHEEDRFSGYDSQSDFTVSFGQNLLRTRENMDWNYTLGGGLRTSRTDEDEFTEGVLRAATEFSWDITDNATFKQALSIEAGEQSNITRSETSIQSDIMENLSMKFAFKVKSQSEVPVDREKTDTEASVTLLLRL